MKAAFKRWIGLGTPALALVALVSNAQTTNVPLGTSANAYAYADLEAVFQRATAGRPVDASWIGFLTDQTKLAPSASAPPSGGVIDLEEEPPAGSRSGGNAPRKVLPVASLPCPPEAPAGCSAAADLHRRTALLEQLLTALRTYRDPTADLARSQDVQRLGSTAHLELFLAHSLLYLEGETREDKCASHRRAVEHARVAGLTDDASPSNVVVRQGWEGVLTAARTFYSDSFTRQIPTSLCELRPATSKAATEAALRGAVDERIRARVEREIDATTSTLAAKQSQYASALTRSAVAVPTREIFALRRAVEDTASLEGFVGRDALLLRSAPEGQKSYLDRVRETLAKMNEIRDRASTTEVTALEEEAKGRLRAYNDVLAGLVTTLEDIAALPELDGATRGTMGVCATIPATITDENFRAYADAFDECVTSVARAYSALKDRRVEQPTYMPFVEKVTALSRAYVATMNRPPRH